jgi:hypothetical protein
MVAFLTLVTLQLAHVTQLHFVFKEVMSVFQLPVTELNASIHQLSVLPQHVSQQVVTQQQDNVRVRRLIVMTMISVP